MAFDIDLVSSSAPFGGHLGRLVLRVKHSGAYTRGGVLDLSAMVPNGVQMEQLVPAIGRFVRTGAQLAIQPEYRRVGPVTACAVASSQARVTINPHYLLSGDRVRVRKVLGSTEVVGEWGPISRVSASVFGIPEVTSVTTFSASADSIVETERPLPVATVSAINLTTEVITTSAAHGLAVGDPITFTAIAGCTPVFDPTGILCYVETVPSATTFTVRGLTFSGSAFSGTTYVYPVRTTKKFGMMAIRTMRTFGVASASIASPSVLTTQETHTLQIGDRLHVTSFLDTTVGTSLNGTRRVRTVPSGTTLTLEDESGAVVNCPAGTHTANSGLLVARAEIATAQEFYDECFWEFTIMGRSEKLRPSSITRW